MVTRAAPLGRSRPRRASIHLRADPSPHPHTAEGRRPSGKPPPLRHTDQQGAQRPYSPTEHCSAARSTIRCRVSRPSDCRFLGTSSSLEDGRTLFEECTFGFERILGRSNRSGHILFITVAIA